MSFIYKKAYETHIFIDDRSYIVIEQNDESSDDVVLLTLDQARMIIKDIKDLIGIIEDQ